MSKGKIAVDIDDVLSPQVDVIIDFSNQRYGTALSHADFKAPGKYWGYYEQLWGVDAVEGARRFQVFLREKYPLRQKILTETKQIIQQLKASYDLEIVTSRTADYQQATIEWLDSQLPGIFNGVHFVDLWSGGSRKATKAKICQEIGAGYLVDDNAEHCNLAAEAGVRALLFGEFGWNMYQEIHPNVKRVADWQGVMDYFNGKN